MLWFKNNRLSFRAYARNHGLDPSLTFGMTFLLVVFLLSACGFTPIYAENKSQEIRNIAIDNIPDSAGQFLKNALIDRLQPSGQSDYTLRVTPLGISIENQAIRRDATSTRGEMRIITTLTLIDNKTGEAVLTRPLQTSGGFNQLDNRFATLTSREDLQRRLLNEMSENIVTEISVFIRNRHP